MEAIIFCGVQASGKTSFYAAHFLKTHLRISLDMLHTRNKEKIFLETCLSTGQSFVIDNTNPLHKDRQRYFEMIGPYRCNIIGYYFHTTAAAALERNANRTKKEKIPIQGVLGTFKKLKPPVYEEGFDKLFWVEIVDGNFVVHEGEFHMQSTSTSC